MTLLALAVVMTICILVFFVGMLTAVFIAFIVSLIIDVDMVHFKPGPIILLGLVLSGIGCAIVFSLPTGYSEEVKHIEGTSYYNEGCEVK